MFVLLLRRLKRPHVTPSGGYGDRKREFPLARASSRHTIRDKCDISRLGPSWWLGEAWLEAERWQARCSVSLDISPLYGTGQRWFATLMSYLDSGLHNAPFYRVLLANELLYPFLFLQYNCCLTLPDVRDKIHDCCSMLTILVIGHYSVQHESFDVFCVVNFVVVLRNQVQPEPPPVTCNYLGLPMMSLL